MRTAALPARRVAVLMVREERTMMYRDMDCIQPVERNGGGDKNE